MRELRVRAWSLERKCYVDVLSITFNDEGLPGLLEFEHRGLLCKEPAHNFVIEQDTGLKDKNGTKIHEGDIVGFYEYYLNEETGEDEPGELEPWGQVVYEEKKARFGVWGDSPYEGEDRHFFDLVEGLEGIGNIHENSELVEGAR